MRIEFVSGARASIAWSGAMLTIGSAADDDVRLTGADVAARHVSLTQDRRGLVLQVREGAAAVYVNARPVRARALLRLGDSIGIGGEQLRLSADSPGHDDGAAPAASSATTMALRAVAGPLSGRVWSIHGELAVAPTGPTDATGDNVLRLAADAAGARMDATALDNALSVRVNGIAARQARVHDGDQLTLGAHRFVLDCSAVEPRAEPETTDAEPESPHTRAIGWQMGWLLVTAVIVALVLAWVLLEHY